jgi:AmmeMemoRadiSam system protein A
MTPSILREGMSAPPDSGRPGAGGEAGGSVSRLAKEDKEILLKVAWDAVEEGVRTGRGLHVDPEEYPPALQKDGAAFVTLKLQGRLRGCIGSYLPRRPLVTDVAENAFAAALRDPRFPWVTEREFYDLELHVSILSPLSRLEVDSEEALIGALRPGTDGLLLEDSRHRAIFLPQVWESLPDPRQFLAQLKVKAGLTRDHWSPKIRFHRYTVEEL